MGTDVGREMWCWELVKGLFGLILFFSLRPKIEGKERWRFEKKGTDKEGMSG